jgi:hypothetical protein
MMFPSLKKSLFALVSAVALVPLAATPAVAQYGAPGPSYAPGYGQPQYQQPQYQQQPQNYPDQYPDQQGYAPQQPVAAPMSAQQAMAPDQLEQLLAPIALYPDALVAQILAGATYPAQIAAADQMVHQMGMADPNAMAAEASSQTTWDPSIKALTAYPQVLDMLAGNLQWTTVLGNAYYNQPQDVLQTVQVMRMRAQQAGTLVNTPQMQVMQNAGYISLAPPTPDMMYVPTYNPWTAYGSPVQPYPGFSFTGILSTLANAFMGGGFGHGGGFGSSFGNGGGPLQFLASFALGAFNRTPFGLVAWGLDWLVNALTFHHNDYYTASHSVRDWGLPHGGARYYARTAYAGNRFGGYGNGYNHEAIAVHGGARFGENTFGNRMQTGFNHPQPVVSRPGYGGQQFAANRGQEPAFRGQYGNGFAGRTVSTPMPARQEYGRSAFAGNAMQPSRQVYQSPMGGNYGNNSRQNTMAFNGAQNFHQDRSGSERSGGSFGAGHESSFKEPKSSYKEPKMPKMQSFKAPKEHFSSGGGGGHFGGGHSSGGHSGGGHHH